MPLVQSSVDEERQSALIPQLSDRTTSVREVRLEAVEEIKEPEPRQLEKEVKPILNQGESSEMSAISEDSVFVGNPILQSDMAMEKS